MGFHDNGQAPGDSIAMTATLQARVRTDSDRETPPNLNQSDAPALSTLSSVPGESSDMTLLEFVETRFVPLHVLSKSISGRTHYHAILKHLLRPERVDRIFAQTGKLSRGRLKEVAGWPYLDGLRLSQITPDHVSQLIDSGVAQGYSSQTVTHIRSVLGAIFSCAVRERCFWGSNPALAVQKPRITRKRTQTLSARQMRDVLRMLAHPEREIVLLTFLGNMTISEVCALQWEDVNLANSTSRADNASIPARSILVRRQRCAEHVHEVTESRLRTIAITPSLRSVLEDLRKGQQHPAGLVIRTRSGRGVSPATLRDVKLKPIGRALGIPWLSWQSLKRGRFSLLSQLQKESADRMIASAFSQEERPAPQRAYNGAVFSSAVKDPYEPANQPVWLR